MKEGHTVPTVLTVTAQFVAADEAAALVLGQQVADLAEAVARRHRASLIAGVTEMDPWQPGTPLPPLARVRPQGDGN